MLALQTEEYQDILPVSRRVFLSLFRPYISHKFVGFGRANLTRDILPFGRTVHEYVSECARAKIVAFVFELARASRANTSSSVASHSAFTFFSFFFLALFTSFALLFIFCIRLGHVRKILRISVIKLFDQLIVAIE